MFDKLKLVTALVASLTAQAAMATTEPLYITDGDHFTIQKIVGNTITATNSSMPSLYLYAIAVRNTIWLAAYSDTGARQEFNTSLSTTANSGSVVWPPGNPEIIDGATDGTYNYTIADSSGIVYRYNSDWSGNPVAMFTAGCIDWCPGITYDSRNHTFWTIDGTNFYQYAANGTLISSFAHGLGANSFGGIAYESSTDTLWDVDNGSLHTLYQFSKGGSLLQTQTTTTDYSDNVWGAEFPFNPQTTSPIPTLSQWGLMLLSAWLAVGTFFMMRRKRI